MVKSYNNRSPYGRGIHWRNKPHPWQVGFNRNGKTIYLGVYYTLREARSVAEDFLRNEAQCPSPLPSPPTATAKPYS